jgi:hypothetical protein
MKNRKLAMPARTNGFVYTVVQYHPVPACQCLFGLRDPTGLSSVPLLLTWMRTCSAARMGAISQPGRLA